MSWELRRLAGEMPGWVYGVRPPFGLDDASRSGRGKELIAEIAGRKGYSIAEGTAVTIAEIASAAPVRREGVCSGRMAH